MITLKKIRKQTIGEYEKILQLTESILDKRTQVTTYTNNLTDELLGLKQIQEFATKQIESFDKWAEEQSRLLGKEYNI